MPVWFTLLATGAVFSVMLSLGLLLEREHFAAALQRRVVVAAILFAVVVPVPALAVALVMLFDLRPPIATGILLMSISPGAPVALRRVVDLGGHARFAPALHLAIVILAVVTVPLSVAILNGVFNARFVASPQDVARQVFVAQILPVAIGAAVRAWRPTLAAAIQPPLARAGNVLLLAAAGFIATALWPLIETNGWTPLVAGVALTAGAMVVSAASAGRDRAARPPAAIAAALRNPGLAILIATVNHAGPAVIGVVFVYAVGATAVVIAYLARLRRKEAA